jgi:predicted RND superfamily exporter protein
MPTRRSQTTIANLAVVTLITAGVAFAVVQLPSVQLQNNLETWLADDDVQAQTLRRMEALFPKEERIVVAWDSNSLTDDRVSRFRDLLTESNYVSKVRTAADVLQRMTEAHVDEAEALQRLTGVMVGPCDSITGTADDCDQMTQSNVLTVVTLSQAGIADTAAATDDIRAAAISSGVAAEQLHLDGAAVTSLAVDQEVWRATWNTDDPLTRPPVFVLSAISGFLLAFAVLRSVRVGLIITALAWLIALVTTSLFPAFGHTMNMVTIVMPTLLVVLTISAGIHVVNYWSRAAADGDPDPIRKAVLVGWRPCLLAAATTGVGLLSLAISKLGPIRDFGIFSTIGMVLSFCMTITVLPCLLRLAGAAPGTVRTDNAVWRTLALRVCRHRRLMITGALVLGITCAVGLQWLETEVQVGRYFPEDSQLIQDSQFFEENIGGVSSVSVLLHFDDRYTQHRLFLQRLEFVREIEDALRQHPQISGAVSLADFQPRLQPPDEESPRSDRMKYSLRSRRVESKVKTDEREASAEYLALPQAGSEWTIMDPLGETWRITVQTRLVDKLDYGQLARELSDIVDSRTQQIAGLSFDVTGSVPVFYRAQVTLLNSLIRSLGLAFVVIAGVMVVLLRSFPAGLMSSVPGILPVAVVFGLMSWQGHVLDIGTMLTGSVAMGIAVDNMLHLLTWFREAIRAGSPREEAVVRALSHCGTAMTHTSLVVGLSLLLMYPADLMLISRFGLVMAALLGVAWLSSVLLLPALLAGPLGNLIEARERHPVRHAESQDKRSPLVT